MSGFLHPTFDLPSPLFPIVPSVTFFNYIMIHAQETDVFSVARKFSSTMEDKILKAIVVISGKAHHRPWKATIYDHFVKEGIKCSIEQVETGLDRLV